MLKSLRSVAVPSGLASGGSLGPPAAFPRAMRLIVKVSGYARNSSVPARFTPESGHRSMQSACRAHQQRRRRVEAERFGWGRASAPTVVSSLRKQGPIATGVSCFTSRWLFFLYQQHRPRSLGPGVSPGRHWWLRTTRKLRRRNPQFLQRLEHLLRRLHLDDEGFAGLQQALEAGEDRRPAGTAAGQDVVADRPVVRLGHGEPDGVAGRLDFVGDERRPELFDQRRPVDVEGDGEFARGNAFDHLAADVERATRGPRDILTAHP